MTIEERAGAVAAEAMALWARGKRIPPETMDELASMADMLDMQHAKLLAQSDKALRVSCRVRSVLETVGGD